jgi:DNA-binding Lrp family transcriptional regulator
MRDVEVKLISELMKNSRRSDRVLAKAIGISQPTVTRIRMKLEREGYINEYTMIPNYLELGFHIVSINFIKLRESLDAQKLVKAREFGQNIADKVFPEVIVAERGKGLGYQAVFVSLHKDYTAYVEFVEKLKRMHMFGLPEIESFLINLDDKIHYRYLTFSTLAQFVLTLKEKKEKGK